VLEIRGLTEEPNDADRAVARTLLADRPAEDLVATLVHMRREARPEPEELTMPMSMRPAPPKAARGRELPKRGPRPAPSDTVWFTINVGRSKNADPKWLIPLLCRRGKVNKDAIGKIQILARETRVEIVADLAEQFAVAARRPDAKDKNIHIERADNGDGDSLRLPR
jgi:ATP-dependent RNA helicase DeaD